MADIEKLEAHQEPPEDCDWIKVDRGAAGGYYVHISIAAQNRVTLSTSVPLAESRYAMELAEVLASRNGIKTVYTKGI